MTLEGIAASTDERHAIVEVVSQIAGVKGVDNKLKVMKDVRIFPSSKIWGSPDLTSISLPGKSAAADITHERLLIYLQNLFASQGSRLQWLSWRH